MNDFETIFQWILKIKHPEDLFPDVTKIKSKYRELADILHPDKNPDNLNAEEAFKILNDFHVKVKAKIEAGTYGKRHLATIKSKVNTYEVSDLIATGSICNVYAATNQKDENVVVKIPRNPSTKDLMINERNSLKSISESDVKDLKVMAHIPKLLESFELQTGGVKKQVNVLTRLSNSYTIEQVRNRYPEGVNTVHAAWMFNRMLGSFVATHQAGLVHCALTPDNFMVTPEDHNGILIDWSYAVKNGEKAKAIAAKWESFYAPEMLAKEKLSFSADIYMAAKTIVYVLGGNPETKEMPSSVPNGIQGLLRYCFLGKRRRPQDAYDFFGEFQSVLRLIYGEPKFHQFIM